MSSMSSERRNRLFLWAALILLVGGLIWAARKVLLPYILGLVLAYILLPLVNWLDRHMPARFHTWRVARPLAIILTYLFLFILVGGIVAFFVPVVVDQAKVLIENWPDLAGRPPGCVAAEGDHRLCAQGWRFHAHDARRQSGDRALPRLPGQPAHVPGGS